MIRLPPIEMNLAVMGIEHLDFDGHTLMQELEQAILHLGNVIQGVWTREAIHMKIRRSGAYIRGIQQDGRIEVETAATPPGQAIASGRWTMVLTVTNTAPHASIVEDGHGAFSLVSAINWGRLAGRVKRSKSGVPMLHIPFRQYTPAAAGEGATAHRVQNMMPQAIYKQAQRLERTRKQNTGERRSPSGQFVAADRYKWGGRLRRGPVRTGFVATKQGLVQERRGERTVGRTRQGSLTNPAWKNSRFEGMFKGGPRGHTQYMTIRTITPNSKGWNIPAQHGLGVARRVASMMKMLGPERISAMLENALK